MFIAAFGGDVVARAIHWTGTASGTARFDGVDLVMKPLWWGPRYLWTRCFMSGINTYTFFPPHLLGPCRYNRVQEETIMSARNSDSDMWRDPSSAYSKWLARHMHNEWPASTVEKNNLTLQTKGYGRKLKSRSFQIR